MITPPDDQIAAFRLAAIVESSFDAIVSKDLNSVVQTWNPAAQRLFGYSAEEMIGTSITILIPDNLVSEEAEIIGRIRRGERLESFETIRRRKDGSLVEVSLTVSPILGANGEIIGASKIARDISASKENERRIAMLMREVNHRVKNQFAVILSMVRETAKRTRNPQELEKEVRDRIMALARSQDLLVNNEWVGAGLFELIEDQMQSFGQRENIALSGPLIMLEPNAVQNLGMALHELGTNSVKHGALSDSEGRVEIAWRIEQDAVVPEFHLVWREDSTAIRATTVDDAVHRGFGSVVLGRVTPESLGGSATLERQDGRLEWRLRAPLASIRSRHRPIEISAAAETDAVT